MLLRLILPALALLCLFLDALVWRSEYGSRNQDIPVPEGLIWRKILTAPEASSLNIYQNGRRSGFCEFSTSIEQEMAQLDDNRPPPEGLLSHSGYQIHLNGNTSVGEFTNRIKFDGHLQFAANRDWRSLDLRILMRGLTLELQSAASNQTLHLSFTSDGERYRHTFTFAELRDPNQLLRSLAGDLGGGPVGLFAGFGLPALPSLPAGPDGPRLHWQASRTRDRIGHETVPVYRLETRVLDRPVTLYVSTLGEILRVELPGDLVATIDEWGRP
jgi:hypothetical protein